MGWMNASLWKRVSNPAQGAPLFYANLETRHYLWDPGGRTAPAAARGTRRVITVPRPVKHRRAGGRGRVPEPGRASSGGNQAACSASAFKAVTANTATLRPGRALPYVLTGSVESPPGRAPGASAAQRLPRRHLGARPRFPLTKARPRGGFAGRPVLPLPPTALSARPPARARLRLGGPQRLAVRALAARPAWEAAPRARARRGRGRARRREPCSLRRGRPRPPSPRRRRTKEPPAPRRRPAGSATPGRARGGRGPGHRPPGAARERPGPGRGGLRPRPPSQASPPPAPRAAADVGRPAPAAVTGSRASGRPWAVGAPPREAAPPPAAARSLLPAPRSRPRPPPPRSLGGSTSLRPRRLPPAPLPSPPLALSLE